jgi:hypothetical protein
LYFISLYILISSIYRFWDDTYLKICIVEQRMYAYVMNFIYLIGIEMMPSISTGFWTLVLDSLRSQTNHIPVRFGWVNLVWMWAVFSLTVIFIHPILFGWTAYPSGS